MLYTLRPFCKHLVRMPRYRHHSSENLLRGYEARFIEVDFRVLVYWAAHHLRFMFQVFYARKFFDLFSQRICMIPVRVVI
jgi:hypothetical protein